MERVKVEIAREQSRKAGWNHRGKLSLSMVPAIILGVFVCLFEWGFLSPEVAGAAETPKPECAKALASENVSPNLHPLQSQYEALELVISAATKIFGAEEMERAEWHHLVRNFIIPGLKARKSLVVATIIGGGSAGKSTLFNSIPSLMRNDLDHVDAPVSATGYEAGMTKQMVVAIPSGQPPANYLEDLTQRFGEIAPWKAASDSLNRGPGVVVQQRDLPANVAFIDSPDFDSGPPNLSKPQNFDQALRVIYPSDVLIGVFNQSSYLNHTSLQILHQMFDRYGRKRMILIFLADPANDIAEIRPLITKLSNSLFDETNPNELPPEVIGTYLMAYSQPVIRHLQNSQLIPLGRSPEFRSLVQQMSDEAEKIRQYTLSQASKAALRNLELRVGEVIKAKLAAQVYAKGLEVVARSAAREQLRPYPFNQAVAVIHQEFQRHRAAFDRVMHSAMRGLGNPWEPCIAFFKKLWPHPFSSDAQRSMGGQSSDATGFARFAIAKLFLQIRQGAIIESPQPGTEAKPLPGRAAIEVNALATTIDRFLTLFPEEKEKPSNSLAVVRSDGGRTVRIQLPPETSLPTETRQTLEQLINRDPVPLATELERRIRQAEFATPQDSIIRRRIALALNRSGTLKRRGFRYWLRTIEVSGATIPVLDAAFLYNQGINHWIVWGLAIILPANLASRMAQKVTEQNLRRDFDRWYFDLQYRTAAAYFTGTVLAPITQLLTKSPPGEDAAIQELQHALKFLDPEYTPLPLTIEK